jgi:hypothetical protein
MARPLVVQWSVSKFYATLQANNIDDHLVKIADLI